jgi:hypothetical protein
VADTSSRARTLEGHRVDRLAEFARRNPGRLRPAVAGLVLDVSDRRLAREAVVDELLDGRHRRLRELLPGLCRAGRGDAELALGDDRQMVGREPLACDLCGGGVPVELLEVRKVVGLQDRLAARRLDRHVTEHDLRDWPRAITGLCHRSSIHTAHT